MRSTSSLRITKQSASSATFKAINIETPLSTHCSGNVCNTEDMMSCMSTWCMKRTTIWDRHCAGAQVIKEFMIRELNHQLEQRLNQEEVQC